MREAFFSICIFLLAIMVIGAIYIAPGIWETIKHEAYIDGAGLCFVYAFFLTPPFVVVALAALLLKK